MSVYGLLMFFGFTLLLIGALSVFVSEIRRNFEGGKSDANAEATISAKAIKIMGQPALVFGICCLVMAFAVDYVASSKPSDNSGKNAAVPIGTVEEFSEGGVGALLVTIPYNQGVQLFDGEVVMKDWGGPKVDGAFLSESLEGPFEKEKISRNPGEQCFLRRGNGNVYRINLLQNISTERAIYSIHRVVPAVR